MEKLNFSQQDGLFDPALAQPLILLGAGAVGSEAALKVAKLGCPLITAYDPDSVSSHNVPMSAYGRRMVGTLKVHALRDLLLDHTGTELDPVPERYADQPLRGPVLCCVDSMEARQAIWAGVRQNPLVDVLIDTRMGATYGEVYTIHPHDPDEVAFYESRLIGKKDAIVRQVCGQHGIGYLVGMLAALACHQLARHWKGERCDVILNISLGDEPLLTSLNLRNKPRPPFGDRHRPPGVYEDGRLVIDLSDNGFEGVT